jgi:hypothetical protein
MTDAAANEAEQARIFNAFNPLDAATPAQYFDTASARGTDGALVKEFERYISLARENYVRFLFAGHIGSGKSSELQHLREKLLHGAAKKVHYFPVLIDTNDYVADYDADAIDLLLAIVAEIAASLREELNIELKESYFRDRFRELKQFLLSNVELTEGEVTIWNAKVKLRRLKADEIARGKVREALRPQVSTILAEIDALLNQVRAELGKNARGFTDIVLIVDNLEKIRKVANADEGFPSHKELFLEQYTKLTGFKAHVIYTVPLRLVRSTDAPQLPLRYDAIFVLPAVKTRDRSGQPFAGGIDALISLIERRVRPATLPSVIETEALRFLIEYSGGHVRHLMLFVPPRPRPSRYRSTSARRAKRWGNWSRRTRARSPASIGRSWWRWSSRRIRRSKTPIPPTSRCLRTPRFSNIATATETTPSRRRSRGTPCIRSSGS